MKHILLLLWLLLALAGGAGAQSATAPNEDARLTSDTANIYSFKWYGHLGRTYFIQTSPDLFTWTYLSEIISGANLVASYGLETNAEKLFLRLQFSDFPTNDPFNDDFDGDGDSNLLELLSNTDPLQAGYPWDQDGDGLADANELPLGGDPLRKDNPNVHLAVFGFAAP